MKNTFIASQKQPIKGETWIGNIDRAVTLIGEKKNFLFCGDIDPDAVGSMVALALFLRLMDKKASIVLTGGLSENLNYLVSILSHNSIRILKTENEIKDLGKNLEVIIICDTANIKLIPFYSVLLENFISKNLQIIEIDHHFGADSADVTRDGIKLFREANSTTEIIGELLQSLTKSYPNVLNPFNQRNILLGLITGLLGDTVGGKVVLFKNDFDYWMKEWGERLMQNTRWRKAKHGRSGDSKDSKFKNPENVRKYLDYISTEQEKYLKDLTSRVDNQDGFGFLNLMNSTAEMKYFCAPYNSGQFRNILEFLLNRVPEKTGKVGVVCYNGINAEGKDCIFIKIRRAIDYNKFDLRQIEGLIKSSFEGYYMGGGGHPNAVSFRVAPCIKDKFILKFKPVADFIKANIK